MNESVTNLKERDDNVFFWKLDYHIILFVKKKIEKFTKIPEVPIFWKQIHTVFI